MKLFNSLSRKLEEFEPLKDKQVGMYTCGPTVYDYVTIGNWRTYTLGDLVFRTLSYLGFSPRYFMNITDVGHLTGDNLGDADTGEDRLEKAAKRESKTAWEVAKFYTDDFLLGFAKLNLTQPEKFTLATDHIQDQIELVKKIEVAGFAYKIDDGVYFDVAAYEKAGNTYGQLSTLDQIREGARVEANPQKRDPRDFALWKFSPKNAKRDMEWDSPWGKGFPGWHIECSAMSMKYLGEQFDLHLGGEDLRSTHHPNEIAQAEAGTGKKPFVKYWLHGAFLTVDGGRMGKSLGNAYTLKDIEVKGFNFLDLRYFYLTGHYRKPLNFTWEGLTAAAVALKKLRAHMVTYKSATRTQLSSDKLDKVTALQKQFRAALEADLNLPEAMAVVWAVVKSSIPSYDKYDLLREFDQVLGLDLEKGVKALELSPEMEELLWQRQQARQSGDFGRADEIRNILLNKGLVVTDTDEGQKVTEAA